MTAMVAPRTDDDALRVNAAELQAYVELVAAAFLRQGRDATRGETAAMVAAARQMANAGIAVVH